MPLEQSSEATKAASQFLMEEAERYFPTFLDENLPLNPLKCEYLLPIEVDRQLRDDLADVKVLESEDVWYGITYREDKEGVVEAISQMHGRGAYPTPLWN